MCYRTGSWYQRHPLWASVAAAAQLQHSFLQLGAAAVTRGQPQASAACRAQVPTRSVRSPRSWVPVTALGAQQAANSPRQEGHSHTHSARDRQTDRQTADCSHEGTALHSPGDTFHCTACDSQLDSLSFYPLR